MRIVGIDPSLTATGIYVMGDGFSHHELIQHGSVPAGSLISAELLRMRKVVRDITEHIKAADIIVIEKITLARPGAGAAEIAGLGYLLRDKLYSIGQVIEVAPTQLKKFISGKGNVNKDVVLKNVFKVYQFDTDDNNIADACVLAHIGACFVDREEPRIHAQRDVIEALKNPGMKRPKKSKKAQAAA